MNPGLKSSTFSSWHCLLLQKLSPSTSPVALGIPKVNIFVKLKAFPRVYVQFWLTVRISEACTVHLFMYNNLVCVYTYECLFDCMVPAMQRTMQRETLGPLVVTPYLASRNTYISLLLFIFQYTVYIWSLKIILIFDWLYWLFYFCLCILTFLFNFNIFYVTFLFLTVTLLFPFRYQ